MEVDVIWRLVDRVRPDSSCQKALWSLYRALLFFLSLGEAMRGVCIARLAHVLHGRPGLAVSALASSREKKEEEKKKKSLLELFSRPSLYSSRNHGY